MRREQAEKSCSQSVQVTFRQRLRLQVCVCVNSHQCVLCDERLTGRVCVADAFHLEIQDLGRGNCKHSFLCVDAL